MISRSADEERPLVQTKKLSIDEKRDRVNSFITRFDVSTGEPFLLNIWTGETIIENVACKGKIVRHQAFWRRREPPQEKMKLLKLDQVPFLSRPAAERGQFDEKQKQVAIISKRQQMKIRSEVHDIRASTRITAAARGYLTRKSLFFKMSHRFKPNLDETSGYLYFYDIKSHTTSWHRPRMLTGSIFLLLSPKAYEAKYYHGNPNTRSDEIKKEEMKIKGALNITPRGYPRLHRGAAGPLDDTGFKISYSYSSETYSKKIVFAPVNKISASETIVEDEETVEIIPPVIDDGIIDEQPFQIVILWMDTEAQKVPSFGTIRTASDEEDWLTLTNIVIKAKSIVANTSSECTEKQRHEAFIEVLYGLHTMSRLDVKLEPVTNILTVESTAALDFILSELFNNGGRIGMKPKLNSDLELNYMMFLFSAFYNIIGIHSGRLELFNTRDADRRFPDFGSGWERAKNQRFEEILTCIGRYLAYLPTETRKVKIVKGSKEYTELIRVSKRGAELADIIYLSLGAIARDRDIRESAAYVTTDFILHSLLLCADDVAPVVSGLRCLYNFCFRCQEAHQIVIDHVGPEHMTIDVAMERIREGSAFSEFETRREFHRLQLALKDEGWRGNVEDLMQYPPTWDFQM